MPLFKITGQPFSTSEKGSQQVGDQQGCRMAPFHADSMAALPCNESSDRRRLVLRQQRGVKRDFDLHDDGHSLSHKAALRARDLDLEPPVFLFADIAPGVSFVENVERRLAANPAIF